MWIFLILMGLEGNSMSIVFDSKFYEGRKRG